MASQKEQPNDSAALIFWKVKPQLRFICLAVVVRPRRRWRVGVKTQMFYIGN
jgi:hypothetical protein